jgi:hypothetical protein
MTQPTSVAALRICHCGQPAHENAYGHSCDQWPLCEAPAHSTDPT